LERGITTLVTTHHPELKAFAQTTPGVVNASVEFDLESLKPTYHLTIGLPGRSNALAIAERLGLPDEIITKARGEINPTDLRAEDMLDEIHRQRDLARAARDAAEEAHKGAEAVRLELASRLENVEDERRELLEEARIETQEKIKALNAELKSLRRELKRHRQPVNALSEIEDKIQELEEQVEEPVERRLPDVQLVEGPIRLGSKVRLRTLGNIGVVTALSEEEAEVQIGVLRIRARLAELELIGSEVESEPIKEEKKERQTTGRHKSPGVELDLRGNRAEDALEKLESYLERAYLAKLPWVRIIHGKGTGKLRKVVREALSQHTHVRSYEGGKGGEGGEGVTVAKLQS
jgi:DNA mismatch repair protein MutS2